MRFVSATWTVKVRDREGNRGQAKGQKGLTLQLRAREVSCYAGHRSRDTGEILLEYIVYLSSHQPWNNLDFVFCSIATLHATKKWLFISDVETRLNVTKLLDKLASYDHEQVALSLGNFYNKM